MTAEVFERSPLAGREDELARIGARELAFPTQLSVRTRSPEALGLPIEPNTWTAIDDREVLWLGPDEWLVVGAPGAGLSFARGTFARYDLGNDIVRGFGSADALVDVSASRAVIELWSDDAHDARRLLEQGCPIDLHPSGWWAGRCAQTLLARVPVILQAREGSTRVFVRPSFANWLADWLAAAGSSG